MNSNEDQLELFKIELEETKKHLQYFKVQFAKVRI